MEQRLRTTLAEWQNDFRKDRFKFFINAGSLLILIVSFVLVYLLYATGRSLWADEATLAYSITTRNLSNLTATILKHRQSAPVIYVYIVKIITLIGDNNEFFLRIYSLIAYTGSLILTYKILKNMIRVKYPVLGPAFTASMMIMLYFSNEFKQYMSDSFSVLMVIYLVHLVDIRKIKLITLLIIYAFLVWLAFPAIFFIGGVAAYLFFRELFKKNWKQMGEVIVGSLVILASFAAQYFFWLKEASENPDLIEHWEFYKFPVIPMSLDDLIHGARLIYGLALSINEYPVVSHTIKFFPVYVVLLLVIGVLSSLKRRNETTDMILLGTLVLMIASFIGKYPFHPRLMLFIYPIIAILVIVAIDWIHQIPKSGRYQKLLAALLIIPLLAGNVTSLQYLDRENRLVLHEESKPLIEYVQQNIQADEVLYLHGADMNLRYLIGYENLHIGDAIDSSVENIRYGGLNFNDGSDLSQDEFNAANAYIMISHANEEKIDSLVDPLLETGYMEKVLEVAKTPLYFHTGDLASVKTSVEYVMMNSTILEQEAKGQIKITNRGPSILNAIKSYQLVLTSRAIPDLIIPVEQPDILPGESVILDWSVQTGSSPASFDLQLQYIGHYWFDELGITPIMIEVIHETDDPNTLF